MHVRHAVTALLLAAAATLPAAAQDYDLDPNYGSVSLTSGFTPDPHRVSLRAGGDMDVARNHPNCRGTITNQPDFRLTFTAGGGALPLIISVAADTDTTLLVNAPDGSWVCDDDGGEGLNPSIRFDRPQSGRYEIWVGTYSPGAAQPATLNISELYSE